MPGHMQAAISAYPELGCTNMPISPRCHWGISQHINVIELVFLCLQIAMILTFNVNIIVLHFCTTSKVAGFFWRLAEFF